MKTNHSKYIRVLGIAPSSRGFGFALMEGKNTLVDWGVKSVKGDKNARSLSSVANLIAHYEPNVIALEDIRSRETRRGTRVRTLVEEIVELGKGENIEVKLFCRKELTVGTFPRGQMTKQALAESLAARFPHELGFRLPRKRRPWMSEDYRMDIFDAVALAQHFLESI